MPIPTRIIDLPQYGNDVFIRARVVYKSNLITCKNGSKQLKLHFMDNSDTISAVAYDENALKLHQMLQYNKVYDLYNICVNVANKSYNKLPNKYELNLNNALATVPNENEIVDVPPIQYNFLTIAEIILLAESTIVDCIAVCRKVEHLQGGTSSFNKYYQKRNLHLVDHTNAVGIELALWNDDACNLNVRPPFFIAVRKAIINVYNNKKSLTISSGSSFEINPVSLPLSVSDKLKKCLEFEWRDSLFSSKNFPPIGYFKTKGVIHCIDCKNLYYEACKRCSKKVCKGSDGLYFCASCNSPSTDYEYKLMLRGEMQSNAQVLSAMPIDHKEYNKYLIENLKKFIQIEK